MRVTATTLPEVLLIEPRIFRDERGFVYEAFNQQRFAAYTEAELPTVFVQDNHSRSATNVLRGLHYQLRRPQGKLVTCVRGKIFDVAVDLRVGSPRFGQWTGVFLDESEPKYLWIPPGFGHGFCVIEGVADVIYKCTDVYQPDDDHGVLWSDPSIGVDWPLAAPDISPKDATYAPLTSGRTDLPTLVK